MKFDKEIAAFETQVSTRLITLPSIHNMILEAFDRYESESKRKTGVLTGFKAFDDKVGGLKPSNMIVVSGETNGGKSTFAFNIANFATMINNEPTAIFSYEMDSQEIIDVLFAINGKVDRNKFNTMNLSQYDMGCLGTASTMMHKAPLYIFDDSQMTLDDIRTACLGIPGLRLVIIDYAQLINVTEYKDSREQQVAHISRSVKRLAKELKIPVIILSQLNDDGKLRESRALAHDANVIILVEEFKGVHKFRVTKGRSIPKGEYILFFDKDYAIMRDINTKPHASTS